MALTLDTDVARKSTKPKGKPSPEPSNRKPMIVQVRGSEGYKAWVEKLAGFDGLPLAALVDRALRRYAKEVGFPDDPPVR